MNPFKDQLRFVIVFMLAHTGAYLFAGGIAYQFITKEFWEGTNPLLSVYLRTPGNADLWNHAMIWQIPGQIARSLLIGLVLLPLYGTLKEWKLLKTFFFISILLFVTTHFSSAVPSPANIEGFIYMRPEFVKLGFMKMQPEMILYCITAGFLFARFAFWKERKKMK